MSDSKLAHAPSVILVNPQMGENIGASMRVMANFGLSDLRLVAPRDGWPNQKAQTMASGAYDMMNVQLFDDLAGAIVDKTFVLASSARPRDMVKPVYTPEAGIEMAGGRSKTALVFGPERTGLTNDDLSLCHGIITVPTNPDFPSLNLAQSVALMIYEWHRQNNDTPGVQKQDAAEQAEVLEFMDRLFNELGDKGFFRTPEQQENIQRSLNNIFVRHELTSQEIRTLHGVVSALIGRKQK